MFWYPPTGWPKNRSLSPSYITRFSVKCQQWLSKICRLAQIFCNYFQLGQTANWGENLNKSGVVYSRLYSLADVLKEGRSEEEWRVKRHNCPWLSAKLTTLRRRWLTHSALPPTTHTHAKTNTHTHGYSHVDVKRHLYRVCLSASANTIHTMSRVYWELQ